MSEPYHVYRLLDDSKKIEIKRAIDLTIPVEQRSLTASVKPGFSYPTKIWAEGQLHWEILINDQVFLHSGGTTKKTDAAC